MKNKIKFYESSCKISPKCNYYFFNNTLWQEKAHITKNKSLSIIVTPKLHIKAKFTMLLTLQKCVTQSCYNN